MLEFENFCSESKAGGCAPPAERPAKAGDAASAKKEFLQRYHSNELEITRLEEEIAAWESRAERVTACFGLVKSGGGDDRIQSAVDNLSELRSMLYSRLADSAALRLEIERCISAIADDRLRLIMEYRYIDGLTWERISEKLHTEYRWVLRLHNRALSRIEL